MNQKFRDLALLAIAMKVMQGETPAETVVNWLIWFGGAACSIAVASWINRRTDTAKEPT